MYILYTETVVALAFYIFLNMYLRKTWKFIKLQFSIKSILLYCCYNSER